MQVDFRPTAVHTGLTPQIFAHLVGGIRVPYSLPPQFHNACNALIAGSCPTSINALHTFRFDFEVNRSYPPIRVGVEVRMLNAQRQVVFCTIIDVLVRR